MFAPVKLFFWHLFAGFMNAIEYLFVSLQKLFGDKSIPWLFVIPNTLFFIIFVFLPFFMNFGYALTGGENLELDQRPYIGMENFKTLLSCENYGEPSTCKDDLFWRSVSNTLVFVFLQIGFMIAFSVITAVLLNRKIRGRAFFRAVYFFPVLLSPVVVALIWKWILQDFGIANMTLEFLDIGKISWLIMPDWAFFWSVFITVWGGMGFYTLIVLAGLQAIPQDVYEAAQMDSSTPTRTFFKITIPLLMPTIFLVLMLATIKGVQTFDEVYALTGGGPGSATFLIIQYIFEVGFGAPPAYLGMAASVSILMIVVLIVLTAIRALGDRGQKES